MNLDREHGEEERIFHAALARTGAERTAFVAQAARGDASLCRRVEELLQAHEAPSDALDQLPGGVLRNALGLDAAEPLPERPGSGFDRYVLQGKLGEGGCGAVYEAEQTHPVRRRVAIKVLKAGMDTRAVVARFQAERQALALMEHEHIARVFDAGETTEGRPFFAMELVRGSRITDYCDEQRLSLPERLSLFARVCDAVQHAHQKGIIHRDLKPSNVLVAGERIMPVPKIIDFGIAKATEGRLADETMVTELDTFIGTPAYMSPEQVDRRGDAIDTRTDIYSLGVILYELLAGSTPLGTTGIRECGIEEVRRRIREVEPPRPSARVRSLAPEARAKLSEHRRLTGPKLVTALAGDLDSMAMKCLEKDPARRYESASALAQDISRYLNGEPVTARVAARWYVWGKFVRRHCLAFGAAAAVMALLATGAVISTALLFRERAALARATAAEREQAAAREAAEKAERQAKTEATRSARATEFMSSVFDGVKPAIARGRDKELLRELLDQAASRLDSALQDEPEVEAELRDTIGQAFWNMDEPHKAASMHRRALELHERSLGPTHEKVGSTSIRLGLFELYHGDSAAAGIFFRRAAEIRERTLGPSDPRTLDAWYFLAEALTQRRQFAPAIEILSSLRSVQARIFPDNDLRLLRTDNTLARALFYEGFQAEADQKVQEVVSRYPADAKEQHLALFRSGPLAWLGTRRLRQGNRSEAIRLLRTAVAAAIEEGQPNPASQLLLAYALHLGGECDEALAICRAVAQQTRQTVSRDPSRRFAAWLARAAVLRAECLAHRGEYAEAARYLGEACAYPVAPGDEITRLHRPPALMLASMLREQGRGAEAREVLSQALRQAGVERSDFTFQLLPPAYEATREQFGDEAADELVRQLLDTEAAALDQQGPTAAAPYSLGVLCGLLEIGKSDLVFAAARKRLEWWERHQPDAAPAHAYRAVVGDALIAQQQVQEAEPLLLRASASLHATRGEWGRPTPWLKGRLDGTLQRLYAANKRPESPGELRQYLPEELLAPEWVMILAEALLTAGRAREAENLLFEAKLRAEELLAAKPGNDHLAAVVAKGKILAEACRTMARDR